MTSTTSNAPVTEEEIDLATLFGTLLDHKWLIIIVTSVFLVCSVAYVVLAPPVYEAQAMVQVEQKVPDLPGLSAITQTLGASSSSATTEIALLTSRTILGKAAIDNLGMNVAISPHRLPLIGGYIARHYSPAKPGDVAGPWLGVSRLGWGGENLVIAEIKVPNVLLGQYLMVIAGERGEYTLFGPTSNPFAHGDLLLRGKVGEVVTGHGVTIRVAALQANPGMRFDVVRNDDVFTINALIKQITIAEEGTDSGIIGLSYTDLHPERAIKLLDLITQLYVKQNVDQNAEEATKSLQFVREQLPIVRDTLDKATEALNAYQESAKSVDITMQTKGLLDQEVAVETSIQQLHQQQADIERRYTHQHPAYQALMQQIGQLQAQKNAIDRQVGKLPDTQQMLLRLTRDVTVTNTTYTSLLAQAQQLDIARAGTVGNVRIVDKASVDVTQPVQPKTALVILGGTFLGGFLAIAYVFLRQMLHRGVEDPAEIEKAGLVGHHVEPVAERDR